jgi:hypothetical protein
LPESATDDDPHPLLERLGEVLGGLPPHVAGEEQGLALLPFVGLPVEEAGGRGDAELRHRGAARCEPQLGLVDQVADERDLSVAAIGCSFRGLSLDHATDMRPAAVTAGDALPRHDGALASRADRPPASLDDPRPVAAGTHIDGVGTLGQRANADVVDLGPDLTLGTLDAEPATDLASESERGLHGDPFRRWTMHSSP